MDVLPPMVEKSSQKDVILQKLFIERHVLDKCCSCHAEINVLRKIYNANKYKKRKLDRIMKKNDIVYFLDIQRINYQQIPHHALHVCL